MVWFIVLKKDTSGFSKNDIAMFISVALSVKCPIRNNAKYTGIVSTRAPYYDLYCRCVPFEVLWDCLAGLFIHRSLLCNNAAEGAWVLSSRLFYYLLARTLELKVYGGAAVQRLAGGTSLLNASNKLANGWAWAIICCQFWRSTAWTL